MIDYIGQKVLVTTSNWFYAPDGKQYRAVWGTLKGIHEAGKSLGFIPNRAHANWFVEVGDIIIMGCQVMYLIKSEQKPVTDYVKDWTYESTSEAGVKEYARPPVIWIAEGEINQQAKPENNHVTSEIDAALADIIEVRYGLTQDDKVLKITRPNLSRLFRLLSLNDSMPEELIIKTIVESWDKHQEWYPFNAWHEEGAENKYSIRIKRR